MSTSSSFSDVLEFDPNTHVWTDTHVAQKIQSSEISVMALPATVFIDMKGGCNGVL